MLTGEGFNPYTLSEQTVGVPHLKTRGLTISEFVKHDETCTGTYNLP